MRAILLGIWLQPLFLSAFLGAQPDSLLFPHLVNGRVADQPNRTRILIQNNSGQTVSGRILFRRPDGTPLDILSGSDPPDAVTFTAAPWGNFEWFSSGEGDLESGTAEVALEQGDLSSVSASLIFEVLGHFASIPGSPPAGTLRFFASERLGESTAFALFNPHPFEVAFDAILVDGSGQPVSSSRLSLAPFTQLARFLGEADFLPLPTPAPDTFRGTLGIHVLNGQRLSAISLIQKRGSGAITVGPSFEEAESSIPPQASRSLRAEVLATFPHDTSAFTQGLVWSQGRLFESTGRYGASSMREVTLETGEILIRRDLEQRFFGEGLAWVDQRLIQLTWREETAFSYDSEDLEELARTTYEGEGWGLTYDGNWLLMSDGSDRITFRDPATFAIWRQIRVAKEGSPVTRLNELEWVSGRLYANVWQTDQIIEIDPNTGVVTAVIDASDLPYRPRNPEVDVLNGIAYLESRGTFLITGKFWPEIYEVRWQDTSEPEQNR